jgi:hypothetical protein
VPRPRRHPLTSAVRRALRRPGTPGSRRFLALLDRRLAALAAGRAPRVRAGERDLARRFLSRVAGRWDDGDENLVRGYLDRWRRSGASARQEERRALLEAAATLGRIVTRPGTLWFFLWEMESVVRGLEAPDGEAGAAADKPLPAC